MPGTTAGFFVCRWAQSLSYQLPICTANERNIMAEKTPPQPLKTTTTAADDTPTDEDAPAGPDTSKHDEETDRAGWRGDPNE